MPQMIFLWLVAGLRLTLVGGLRRRKRSGGVFCLRGWGVRMKNHPKNIARLAIWAEKNMFKVFFGCKLQQIQVGVVRFC